ncbi:hypothetical protein AXE80_09430 [Wenyingzhuangia fucanilytica]|uniref:Gamma-glutamylcyclotransferase AIG2-like domain-containing protein n=1 Tax=Wenyingzhuangia fucanilytica TaxID=1790137 RepID=A0A1B1Y6W6_9FLAO|nr:gamma-glutamylcyclotransferase family protein [Wenyingzhuangia fucanilytica]ANW96487.1 hypothetical protein AXE80_09430 [Wenyingzhuangia fucanilytica]
MLLFFSYGTLQFDKTQIETFGKLLPGTKDILKGYKLNNIKVLNPEIINLIDNNSHPIATLTNNPNDEIIGTVFELTNEELNKINEIAMKGNSNIKKIEVILQSGKKSWTYTTNNLK